MTNPSTGIDYTQIIYPESDGKPVGETEIHVIEFADTLFTLKEFFRDQPDMYAAGNMFLYYEEGIPTAVVCPDLFVVKGISKEIRRIYKLWEEKVPPCFVLELTSRSTRIEDIRNKRELYAKLGVNEYFLFDPLEEYLKPPMQGWILVQGNYQNILPDEQGRLFSHELGLYLVKAGSCLQLWDAVTGKKLLRPAESYEKNREMEQQVIETEQRAARMEQQAKLEAEIRRRAEAEIARLKAELARLRGQ